MALQIFDQRMQRSLIDKLDTARGSAAFVWLVMDYMAYLRLTTQSTESWDRKKEMEVATRFVGMINNDVAWPLAEQVVPEFRRERKDATETPYMLKWVLDQVHDRLPAPRPSRADDVSKYEEEMLWKVVKTRIEYLAYGCAGEQAASKERKEEVEQLTSTLREIQKSHVSLPPETEGSSKIDEKCEVKTTPKPKTEDRGKGQKIAKT